MEEAQETLRRLMALYNEVNTGVLQRSDSLPVGCAFHEDILANLDEVTTISQWARGFMLGHGWLEELWDEHLPEALDKECGATVMTLSFFGSRRLAEAYVAEIDTTAKGKPRPSLAEFAQTMRKLFPSALASYAHLGRTIFEVRMQAESDSRAEPVRSSKTGRNEPCPCGSGKKYKKCCGGVLH